jgi:hypothetical protein
MSNQELQTIGFAEMATAMGGGSKKPSPSSNDFAHRYVKNLTDDWNAGVDREKRSADAGNHGKTGTAIKQKAAAFADGVGLIGDAVAPVRAIFG